MAYPSFLQVFPRTKTRPRNGRIVRTPISGDPFVHTMHHARDQDFEVHHSLIPSEIATLDAYYEAQEGLSFTFPHANKGNITCRFVGPPQYTPSDAFDLHDTVVRLAEVDGSIESVDTGVPDDYPVMTHLIGSQFQRFTDAERQLSPGGRAFIKADFSAALIVGQFTLFHEITSAEQTTLDAHFDDHELTTFEYDCPFRGDTWECVWGGEPQYDEINPQGDHFEASCLLLGLRTV